MCIFWFLPSLFFTRGGFFVRIPGRIVSKQTAQNSRGGDIKGKQTLKLLVFPVTGHV